MLRSKALRELAAVFLKLGATAFGGPAAHVGAIQREVVEKRQWLSADRLMNLYGLTNLLPGPNSTELVVAIGQERAGWLGAMVAGISFVLPAMGIVWGLAMLYEQFQILPVVKQLFAGMQPAIAALILQALWKLSRTVMRDPLTTGIAMGSAIACSLGVNELLWLVLMGGGLTLWRNGRTALQLGLIPWLPAFPAELSIFGVFFKIGLLCYGGGYVLIAFLQQELVDRQHLLTSQQLLDAIAIGQITPGPLFTTATFVGYLLGGHGGAIAATVGIFLPGFLAVIVCHPYLEKWQQSPWIKDFLAGVEPAAWGLMAAVAGDLALSLRGWPAYGIGAVSFGLLLYRPQWSLAVIGAAALLGYWLPH
jgi:chromate transporter